MASSAESSTGKPLSPELLIALNEEIAALIRAGVPLELGLEQLGQGAEGALSEISSVLAERMNRGESLPQALAAEGDRFPRLYRVVVEAGLKAGRLPAALEAVSGFTWELLDFRRKISLAALYPLVVVVLAYGLFLVFLAEFVGRFESTYETFRLPVSGSLQVLIAMRDGMVVWAWIPPALLILLIVWWIYAGRRRVATLAGFPIVGAKSFRYAMFADLLSLQIDHAVALPEGIVLAAEATGSPAMRDSAHALATHVSQGGALSAQPVAASGFPPFLRWLMIHGQQQGKLAQALRLAADMYRRRAINRLNWFKVLFPLISGVVIGGGATLFYALGLFLPFINMLNDLGASELSPFR